MNELKMSLAEYIDRCLAVRVKAHNALIKEYNEARDNIIAGKDVEDNLNRYDRACYDLDKFNDLTGNSSSSHFTQDAYTKLQNIYELANKMCHELVSEFNATVEDDVIRFKWWGNTLTFVTQMIAQRYDLHAGIFSFTSSFSRHEAYTKDNHLIHIGIDEKDSNTVKIELHL